MFKRIPSPPTTRQTWGLALLALSVISLLWTPASPVGPRSFTLFLIFLTTSIVVAFPAKRSINYVMFVAAIVGSLFVAEFMLVRVALPYFSYTARHFLPTQYRPLTFNTKDGSVPHSYALVVGDSYAAGMGTSQTYNNTQTTSTPIHYLERLHRRTQTDFLNTGIEGADNIRGFWLHPTVILNSLRTSSFVETIENPSIIIAIFYEGNDFIDNLETYQRHFPSQPKILNTFSLDLTRQLKTLSTTYESQTVREQLHPLEGLRHLRAALWQHYTVDHDGSHTSTTNTTAHLPPAAYREQLAFESKNLSLPFRPRLPPISLTLEQTAFSTNLAVQSLETLGRSTGSPKLFLFYIPSVATCYNYVDKQLLYPNMETAGLANRSEHNISTTLSPINPLGQEIIRSTNHFLVAQMRDRIDATTITFVDLTPAFQQAALTEPIHGPSDWDHFNAAGYRILSNQIEKFAFQP